MAEFAGRKATVSWNGTIISAVTTKSLTINNEFPDITSDDDSAYRTFLKESVGKAIDLTVDGVLKDTALLDDALSGTVQTLVFTFPSQLDGVAAMTITGDFVMPSFAITGEVKAAATYSASFSSSGQWTIA